MLNHRRQILWRRGTLHKGAGVRAELENRAIREEGRVRHKDNPRIGAAVTGVVCNGERLTVREDQIENDHLEGVIAQGFKRVILIARQTDLHTLPFKT